jgi:Alpha amylase, catalytic domain
VVDPPHPTNWNVPGSRKFSPNRERTESSVAVEPAGKRGVEEPWWRRAVVYEIALVSFQDTNGDGEGDLKGLLHRLDYLKWLGVDAVWLTPIYKSPMRDFGYDIADFCSIDPRYGSMEEFDRVTDALHEAGIKIILDLVHTPRMSIPGSSRAALRGPTGRRIGTCGRMPPKMAVRRTTGAAALAAVGGNGARRASSSTIIPF